ncbi:MULTISPECIES: HEAT repeat domain-containing protein [Pseudanabaena]|uniref:PBS lyase HEAT domain protein repeat-containing protein n=2 Tax=Pseudanabaena TaxID=1152 RepID=L8MW86_9CYAN|nr:MULTISPECIES: HEAT repeat domain-containing protein [Pseudanabaena]ELS32227.1 PBS lyase HEAT domain protein repeat-containing protein [Pseudanabaena biceps PCC 7429]MDG3495534.1 HEAT repeat domain-containing protein [Pseudanabaena catenata USMAC16]
MNPESEISDDNQLTIEQALINLQCEDLGLRIYAAWWLGRFRVNVPKAIDLLILALADEADRTEAGGYPLRRNAARALGKLGDRRAVPALIESLECEDFYVREAAAQSLEMLGDRSCLSKLVELIKNPNLQTSTDSEPEHPYDAFLEALGTLGAVEAIPDILPFLEHPTPKVQYAAARAMYQLSAADEANQYGDRLVAALSNKDLQLRRTVLSDLGAIGYLGAAEAISNTMAENSLKLISLKGLLEKQIPLAIPPELTDGAIRVMALMDDLL